MKINLFALIFGTRRLVFPALVCIFFSRRNQQNLNKDKRTISEHISNIGTKLAKFLIVNSMTSGFAMRISAEEFFRDCYGVMSDTFGPEARVVRLKITAFQANYVRDLPLHESQQEIERNDEYSIFELFVRPTYDLYQEVLRMGTQVEVLEPNYMREEILEMIRIMYNQYTK